MSVIDGNGLFLESVHVETIISAQNFYEITRVGWSCFL